MEKMKYLIFSDLHGYPFALDKVLSHAKEKKADCLICLGDILHGGYGEEGGECTRKLRFCGYSVLAVQGNCDYPSDAEVLGFELPYARSFVFEGHTVHLQHRPYDYISFPPKDIVMTGHTHRKVLESVKGVIYLNPGSVSYPRDGSASFAMMDETGIELFDLKTGESIRRLDF